MSWRKKTTKSKTILMEVSGSMAECTQLAYWEDPKDFQTLPADRVFDLDMKLCCTTENGWVVFNTDDGREFYLSQSESENFFAQATIVKGRVRGKFIIVKKGSAQTLRYVDDFPPALIPSNSYTRRRR